MPNYGITFNVTGKSVQEMAQIEESLKKLGVTATRETGRVEDSVKHLDDGFGKLQERIIEVFAVEKVREFAMQVLDVTAEFEGFDNRIKFASENIYDAANNMSFLHREVKDLHLPMRQIMEGFSEMEAGLVGTGITGERLRNLFEGISTAAATLHLPRYQLERTLYDFKEIGEIGLNMRIERSLGTALPGIGGIVKDTFGKSMHELQLEGMSGPAFLDKLGPALKKQFEAGLAQYADSLQAKMADTGNKFLAMQLDLGEKLKPVYISIMDGISGVLTKVGAFVGWANNHADTLSKLVQLVEVGAIAWGVYKTGLMAVTAVEKAQVAILAVENIAMATATMGVKGLSLSLAEIGLSLTTIGWGAFAIGVGLMIKSFYDWNEELNTTVERISKISEIASEFQSTNKTYESLTTAYNAYQKDPSRFTAGEVESIAVGMKSLYDQQHKQMVASVQPHLEAVSDTLKVMPRTTTQYVSGGSVGFGGGEVFQTETAIHGKMSAAADSLSGINQKLNIQQEVLGAALKSPAITKALKDSGKVKYDPIQEAAGHSSHLAGAEGGLGHAKIVNIQIGTVMKVDNHDNKNLVKHAEDAAQFIIRAANNFAESQQGTY